MAEQIETPDEGASIEKLLVLESQAEEISKEMFGLPSVGINPAIAVAATATIAEIVRDLCAEVRALAKQVMNAQTASRLR